MTEGEYVPVPHDHEAFLERARKRKGFSEAYDGLEDEYQLVRELLAARAQAGLTQEEVAISMGTTKSAVSRLEGAGQHSPSVSTLKKYAEAVGCEVEIRLVPTHRRTREPGDIDRRELMSMPLEQRRELIRAQTAAIAKQYSATIDEAWLAGDFEDVDS